MEGARADTLTTSACKTCCGGEMRATCQTRVKMAVAEKLPPGRVFFCFRFALRSAESFS